jgi:hypothetical protein
MKFRTVPTEIIDWSPPYRLRPVETAGSDNWDEDSLTVSSDLGSGFPPDQ